MKEYIVSSEAYSEVVYAQTIIQAVHQFQVKHRGHEVLYAAIKEIELHP